IAVRVAAHNEEQRDGYAYRDVPIAKTDLQKPPVPRIHEVIESRGEGLLPALDALPDGRACLRRSMSQMRRQDEERLQKRDGQHDDDNGRQREPVLPRSPG